MYYESFMCITNDAGLIAYYYFATSLITADSPPFRNNTSGFVIYVV